MATTFQALMALSATQTKQSQSIVESQLAQRQRNEELKRKQAEMADKKRREMENQLRMKHFEEEKRRQERGKRAEAEQQARQAALERREEEQRSALRYGPKKAKISAASLPEGSSPKWPSSSSHNRAREDARKRRLPGVGDDDDSAPEFLTREEKRERKQQMEMRRLFNPTKRSANAGGYSKAGRRLPGGAVDVTTTSQVPDASSSSKSVKERIAAMPNTLTKLNTVKRDTRTIDEILQDRAKLKEKVLDGDEAREFNDWFGSSKKKEVPRKQIPSAATSGANTPASQGSSSTPQPSSQGSITKKVAPPPKSPVKPVPSKVIAPVSVAPKSSVSISRTGTVDKYVSSKPAMPAAKPLKHSVSSATVNGRSTVSTKKRPRSISRSESPPPYKKRARSPDDNDIGNTIWKMFGRDRNAYVGMDVLSDDEDMEVDATVLEKEEKMSARIAKKEDVLALEEERRREEEKRRRKKEKEAREKRN